MIIERVRSIEAISKVYETGGSHPVLVSCQDMFDYVCKYTSAPQGSPAYSLFAELFSSCCLQLWGIATPKPAIVEINTIHCNPSDIPNLKPELQRYLQPQNFKRPCFGSRLLVHSTDVSSTVNLSKKLEKPRFLESVLKIALFDLWICNEDRNANNCNLLLANDELLRTENFVAIDHSLCFNSLNQFADTTYSAPTLLTLEDSILNAPFVDKLLYQPRSKRQEYLVEVIQDLRDWYYLCAGKTRRHVDALLRTTPDEWCIELNKVKKMLESGIFSEKWVDSTFSEFQRHVQGRFLN